MLTNSKRGRASLVAVKEQEAAISRAQQPIRNQVSQRRAEQTWVKPTSKRQPTSGCNSLVKIKAHRREQSKQQPGQSQAARGSRLQSAAVKYNSILTKKSRSNLVKANE
jgi:hypothetical protein